MSNAWRLSRVTFYSLFRTAIQLRPLPPHPPLWRIGAGRERRSGGRGPRVFHSGGSRALDCRLSTLDFRLPVSFVIRHSSFVILLLALPLFAADHLQEIRHRGTLLWGADAEGGAPYVYPDPQKPEQLIGFEVELADALAGKLGVKAKMIQNQWDQLIPALERGNFDIILNGLEITADNQQHLAMSQPYFVYAQQIVTRKQTEGLARIEELKGKPVGVLSSSVAQGVLQKMGGVDLRIYPGNVESLRDLKAKRIDAVLLDLPIALHYAKPDPALKFSGAPFAFGYYGIGVRK